MKSAALALVLTLFAPAVVSAAGEPLRLASHRALYDMTLQRVLPGSAVSNVQGEMVVEWLRACDGWTFEHKSVMTVSFAAGTSAKLVTGATSWESLDGRRYRFSLRNLTNGEESEKVVGTAALSGPRRTGQAEFVEPKRRTVALPAGTLFPVAHTVAVLRAARSPSPPLLFTRMLFDGMGDDGPFSATATIGKGMRAPASPGTPAAGLAGQRVWPVSLAYFPLASADPEPKQEIGMKLYANGVADDLTIGFDDFTVRARLARLEFVPPPRGCSD
jgi:hypothetical protein